MRLSSSVELDINSATPLKLSATLPAIPVQATGKRVLKSPFFRDSRPARTCSTSNGSSCSPFLGTPFFGGVAREICSRRLRARAAFRLEAASALLREDWGSAIAPALDWA